MALVVAGTDFIQMPAGTTAQRPASPIQGMQRYNTTLGYTEVYTGGDWAAMGTQGATAPAALSTASGSAPSYSARAWVNFNGTGTVAIRASGNVSSITDNGVGDYTVNFTAALADENYSVSGSAQWNGANSMPTIEPFNSGAGTKISPTTSNFRFVLVGSGALAQIQDSEIVNVSVFR